MNRHLSRRGGFLRCWILTAGAASALYAQTPAQPLFEALRQGQDAQVVAAIKAGAGANSRDSDGNTLVMQAALYGNAPLLRFLLAHGADVNASNNAGHTALMRAMPNYAKVRLLVEHGANVNAATAEGVTPLMIAASLPTATAVLRYLIRKGADVHALDKGDFNPVVDAALAGAPENLRALLEAGGGANLQTRHALVRLDRSGADVNQSVIDRGVRVRTGFTALMAAVQADCETCVRLLLERGADPKVSTGTGLTALHDAAYVGNPAVVKLMLEAGAPVNAADERGLTPLMLAANSRSKDAEVVRMLLARGADVRAADGSGRSAADWAQTGARREIVSLLPASAKAEVLPAAAAAAPPGNVHAAVARSIALLEKAAPTFFRRTGCISCHNVSIPLMALSEARRHGYAVSPSSTQLMVKQTLASLAPQRNNLLSAYPSVPGLTTTTTYAAISMQREGHAPDPLTDGIARCLMAVQYPDGHWLHGDTRPPLSPEHHIPVTALSARAIQLYAAPALARERDASVARARAYLLGARPSFGDDFAYRLLGLSWTGATPGQIEAAARDLIGQQREDGGWAQTPDRPADAYATGQALSALAMAAPDTVAGPAYRRGVDYLMRTQEADGSWHVRSRAFGFQPYFQSGFPHDHDQWISMAATAWSAMALMPAAESAHLARR